MRLSLFLDEAVDVSIGIYRPRRWHSTEYAIDQLAKISREYESACGVRSAILKCRSKRCLAIYAVFRTRRSAGTAVANHPEEALFRKAVGTVAAPIDVSRYQISCGESKVRDSTRELSRGDAVHLARISVKDPKRHDALSYSCLAILKAYFHKADGLLLLAFYDSMDARRMVGVGAWESLQQAAFPCEKLSPALPFWEGLGAKFDCGLYEVAHVSHE